MRSRRSPALLVAAVVLLPAVAGACSDDDRATTRPSAAQAVLVAAPERTIDAGPARIAVNAAVQGQTRGTFAGDGAFDFRTGKGRLELDLGPLGLAGASRTEVLLDGDVVFLKLGGALPGLGSRPWVRIDLATLTKGRGDGIEALRQLRANDPRAVINLLRGATGDTERVGAGPVRDTDTTHYRATVDLDEAASSSPAALRDDLAEVARQLGTSKLPVEAWLDAGGRIRRLRYTIDLADLADEAPAKGGGAGTVVATLELSDFGTEVSVSPPPPDQTTDLAELLGGPR